MASRIPVTDSAFDQFIQNTDTYNLDGAPITNGERLGLAPAEIGSWTGYRNQWAAIYPQYTNVNTRTKTIKDQKNELKATFMEFAMPLLDRIAASPAITGADRNVYNLPVPDRNPTARGAILETPYVNLKPLGGGMIQVRTRTEADASRASRHPLADAVEVRYKLVAAGLGTGGGFPTPEPGNPNQAGQEHAGKKCIASSDG
jgi:hypothetical protein